MSLPKLLPSQDRLRELFDYDEHTGYLTWRRRAYQRAAKERWGEWARDAH